MYILGKRKRKRKRKKIKLKTKRWPRPKSPGLHLFYIYGRRIRRYRVYIKAKSQAKKTSAQGTPTELRMFRDLD